MNFKVIWNINRVIQGDLTVWSAVRLSDFRELR